MGQVKDVIAETDAISKRALSFMYLSIGVHL